MRQRNSVERRYAEFHNLFTGDFRQDVAIYLDLAAKYAGPVLEVGCGTGRVARELARAGYEVRAIDTARGMLEVAGQELRPFRDRVRITDFDIRHQPLSERYPVALVTLYGFNALIDVEEQRLFLRHLRRSMRSPGIVALDLFCPLFLARPDRGSDWHAVERHCQGHRLRMRDRREMLTPLLERRSITFSCDGEPESEFVVHRRYVSPQQLHQLLDEAGFESILWLERYDLSTARPIEEDARPQGPFMVLAEL